MNDHLFASRKVPVRSEFGLLIRQKRRIGGPIRAPRRRKIRSSVPVGLRSPTATAAGVATTACAVRAQSTAGPGSVGSGMAKAASRLALAARPVRFCGLWGTIFAPADADRHAGRHLERISLRTAVFPAVRRWVILQVPGSRLDTLRGFAARPPGENGG